MKGFFEKGGNYPIKVIPVGTDFMVKNMETGDVHYRGPSATETGNIQERERQSLYAQAMAERECVDCQT